MMLALLLQSVTAEELSNILALFGKLWLTGIFRNDLNIYNGKPYTIIPVFIRYDEFDDD